jgi:hypothetical protein
MGSSSRRTREFPAPCREVLNTVTTEDTTLVDALSRGKLDHDDIERFLDTASEHDIDPGLIRLVEIIDSLLEEHRR